MSESAGGTGAPLRVAVVGCGTIGPRHAEAYLRTGRAELVGVCDLVSDRAREFGDRFGPTSVHTEVGDLLDQQRPDLVSVATPPGTHAQLARQILAAGSSVLLEKPPVLSLAELDELSAAEAASPGSVFVIFQHRHGSGARRARGLLAGGVLGRPQVSVCETLWFRPPSYFDPDWRGAWSGEGGGPTLGHGIHQIDLLLHLLGPWRTVIAQTSRVARPVEFEDVSMAMITFENGSVGTMINSLVSPRELSRIRIDTTGGTLEVDHVYGFSDADWSFHPAPGAREAATLGRDPGVRSEDGGPTAGSRGVTHPDDPWAASAEEDVPSNHVAQITRLVDDLITGRPHQTTLESTRPTMELITAVYGSALLGSPVDRADLVPGHPFYADLSGGLTPEAITATMVTTQTPA